MRNFLTIIGYLMICVSIGQLAEIYMDSSFIGYFTQGGRTVTAVLWLAGGSVLCVVMAAIDAANEEHVKLLVAKAAKKQ